MSRSDGPALDVGANMPDHLREALEQALAGLSEAYLDMSHPLSPQLQALWDAADQIEEWLLSREGE